MNCFNRSYAFF